MSYNGLNDLVEVSPKIFLVMRVQMFKLGMIEPKTKFGENFNQILCMKDNVTHFRTHSKTTSIIIT